MRQLKASDVERLENTSMAAALGGPEGAPMVDATEKCITTFTLPTWTNGCDICVFESDCCETADCETADCFDARIVETIRVELDRVEMR